MLVLEQSRVEVAVLLNELAYLKDEASKKSSPTAESILLKKRNVAIAFSLLEKIINLISNASENEGMSCFLITVLLSSSNLLSNNLSVLTILLKSCDP